MPGERPTETIAVKEIINIKAILIRINRMTSEELHAMIKKLESLESRDEKQRARLLLAHNVMNERLWQSQHQLRKEKTHETR